ncbi:MULTISPECIES: NrtA/SsuA/CpmA family ABC transporter substrate-binding protein [Thermomonosporaceae]|uniref:NrtA/SsuA/CpmA family ABC transporter substrate-binding protein n=1 Tax=Thermomonosporaceae TaxID=2012 RepID=UPI00255AD98F|nr:MULTISPECIES: NrtA/SsuA/CpmA family ABC transporter substrate-binding protein [Thermomonosporaceae]MDL4776494.1 NrtA/SsuA/CpmA family ABC transporter substrate-binding protein [Actinomadura xylanilytica]
MPRGPNPGDDPRTHAIEPGRRRLIAAAAGVALLSLAAACGGAAEAGGSAGDRGAAVLKLKDPGNAGPLAYAKRERILEKRLKPTGVRVEWGGSYASFTATIDAVRSGSVNVLEGAVSPALGYLANSRDIKIFAVTDPVTAAAAPHEDGLVVPASSPVRSVRDLVGKQVAVNRGGRGEYLLLLALQQAGIPAEQVERVYLNPVQGASAFSTGKVDAWWAIVDAYPQVVAKGARVLVHGRDLPDKDVNIWAARTELLDRHPQAVRTLLDVLGELTRQEKREPERFQNVFLKKGPTAVSGTRLADDLAKARHENVPRPAGKDDGRYVRAVNEVFRKYGVLPSDIRPEDVIFDLRAPASPAATAPSSGRAS